MEKGVMRAVMLSRGLPDSLNPPKCWASPLNVDDEQSSAPTASATRCPYLPSAQSSGSNYISRIQWLPVCRSMGRGHWATPVDCLAVLGKQERPVRHRQ